MRFFVLTAFVALQLSVFACGYSIHVHLPDGEPASISQQQAPWVDVDADHACHVHTSHTLIELADAPVCAMPALAFAAHVDWPAPYIKNLLFLIEYPPKATV